MWKKIFFIYFILCLTGCTMLPGMQDINPGTKHTLDTPAQVQVAPTIIPITPTFLVNHPNPPYIYEVGPQDILSIVIWKHAEFNLPAPQLAINPTATNQSAGTAGYLVNHTGKIYFPLIGNVPVAGKTVDQIRQTLTKKLSYYVRNPQVFIRVTDFRSKKIYVIGEVLKPGLFPLNDQPFTITDALTLAGSIDPNAADTRHIYVIRGSVIQPNIYWLNAATPDALLLANQFQLQNKDVVVVSTAVMTRWTRFLNQLLPTLESIWYTKAITGK